MKILLVAVNGSFTHSSLAVRCLRRSLEKSGFEVVIKEFNLKDRKTHILQEIYGVKADVAGFSTYIWNLSNMLEIAESLKKISPETKIVFGGPEVSFDTQRFDVCDFIDTIICGEGEISLPKVCKDFQDNVTVDRIVIGEHNPDSMTDEGILYNKEETEHSIVYYESSRGCPFSCSYCLSSTDDGFVCKDVAQVMADMEEFENMDPDNNIKVIKFVDRTFNYPINRANEIWKNLLDERYTKHYHFEVCASLLNEESFEILKRFPKGKIQLEFGLQSTNEKTIKSVARHINPVKVTESVKRIHDFGNIHVHLDLIAGLPYEGYERFSKSFDDAYFCCDMLQLGFLKLLHGTKLREEAKEYGIKSLTEPPYTVLATNDISYDEIAKLQDISEILERYHESGKFKGCIFYILSCGFTPFAFYEGLCEYIKQKDGRRIQKISQADAYRLLYEYVYKIVSGKYSENSEKILSEFEDEMHKDFSKSEVRKFPDIKYKLQ